MKTAVLLLWSACLAAIALGVLRFVFVATPRERLLTLALVLSTACCLDRNARFSRP